VNDLSSTMPSAELTESSVVPALPGAAQEENSAALVVHGVEDLRLDPIKPAEPRSDEAVVQIAYGGICGSDLHYWLHGAAGESVLREPLVLGHEVVGTVTQAAADGSGPAEGTRVAVHPATPGGDGARYPQDRPNLSPGCTYLGSAARYPHTQGAFSQYAALPTRMLRPLPEGLTLRAAALAEPASVAWHGVARAGDVRGKRALVIGSGPIGCLAVAVLKRAGASEIIAVDVHEEPLQRARLVGATGTILASDADAVAAVEADVTVESSGNHRGLDSAIRGTMRGGKVVMVGLLPSGAQPVAISLAITRELDLLGSFRFNAEMDEVLAALADGSLFVDPVITHEYPFSRAIEAFTTAKDARRSGKVLISFTPDTATGAI
jgi:L-idonate 5-dehydrogenase